MNRVPVSTRISNTRRRGRHRGSPADGNAFYYSMLANGLSWHLKIDLAFFS